MNDAQDNWQIDSLKCPGGSFEVVDANEWTRKMVLNAFNRITGVI